MKRVNENDIVMVKLGDDSQDETLKACMVNIICMLRAMHLWFHSAHNSIYGISFSGDHFSLYHKIYDGIQEEIDDFIERAIGLTADQSMACPIKITGGAYHILGNLPSPTTLMGCEMSEAGRDIIGAYVELLESACNKLEAAGLLTKGLDDLIAGSANVHEGYYYLMQQRAIKER